MRRKGVVIVALLIILLFSLIGSSCVIIGKAGERIAVIYLGGTIAGQSQLGLLTSVGITPNLVRANLDRASRDSGVKAVVLRIDSPGGTAAASQEIAEMIRRFEKPLVVSMGDVAASGGYYISAYADRIVAGPSTMTGSIGVIMQVFNIQGLMEKLGIQSETITSGKYKDLSPPLSAQERAILQEMCDELYEQFIKTVVEGRKSVIESKAKERGLVPEAYVRELATGQLYTGTQALKLGLVDKLGDLDDAINLAAELAGVKKPVVEEYAPPSLLERLFRILAKIEEALQPKLPEDETLFLKTIEGWQVVPRYKL